MRKFVLCLSGISLVHDARIIKTNIASIPTTILVNIGALILLVCPARWVIHGSPIICFRLVIGVCVCLCVCVSVYPCVHVSVCLCVFVAVGVCVCVCV